MGPFSFIPLGPPPFQGQEVLTQRGIVVSCGECGQVYYREGYRRRPYTMRQWRWADRILRAAGWYYDVFYGWYCPTCAVALAAF